MAPGIGFSTAADAGGTGTLVQGVNGPPAIAVPGAQTIGVGQAASIAGVSLSETGNTTGETFTVTLIDTNGVLSASSGRRRGQPRERRTRR